MRKGERASPEAREKMRQGQIRRYQNPKELERNRTHLRRISNDPEVRKKRAETVARTPKKPVTEKLRLARSINATKTNIARGDASRRRAREIGGHCAYILCYPNGEPFYVGAGNYDRPYHAKSRFGASGTICKQILRDGRQPLKIIIETNSPEESQSVEKQLIARYGRKDLGTGCLENRSDGGLGAPGSIVSEANRNRASKAYKGKKRSEEDRCKMREGWARRKEKLSCSQ